MVAVIEIIVLVVLLAAVGGRLLGVRLPLVRAVLAGPAGVAAGVVFGYLVYARDRVIRRRAVTGGYQPSYPPAAPGN
jgi:hypothetical protein